MSRKTWIYGGLLAVLLVLTYLRHHRLLGEDEPVTDVLVYRAEPDEIDAIAYHDEKRDVTVTWKEDDLGRYAWVELEERREIRKPPPPAEEKEKAEGESEEPDPDDAADPAPEGEDASDEEPEQKKEEAGEEAGEEAEEEVEEEVEIEVETSSYKGGEAATKLLEGFAPLRAIRKLDRPDPAKLAELELVEPDAWIEVTRDGQTHRFALGGEAYGTRDRYLEDVENERYFLVDADTIRPLRYAKTRLPDRRLTPYEEEDLLEVELADATGSVTMLQQNHQDRKAAFWAHPADTAQPMEIFENWLDKALRLRALSYVPEDEAPASPELAFRMRLVSEDESPISVEVLKVEPAEEPEGAEASEEGSEEEPQWYARSGFTRGLVRLHRILAAEAAADVRDVIEARPEDVPAEDLSEASEQGSTEEEPAEGASSGAAREPGGAAPPPGKVAPKRLPPPGLKPGKGAPPPKNKPPGKR